MNPRDLQGSCFYIKCRSSCLAWCSLTTSWWGTQEKWRTWQATRKERKQNNKKKMAAMIQQLPHWTTPRSPSWVGMVTATIVFNTTTKKKWQLVTTGSKQEGTNASKQASRWSHWSQTKKKTRSHLLDEGCLSCHHPYKIWRTQSRTQTRKMHNLLRKCMGRGPKKGQVEY